VSKAPRSRGSRGVLEQVRQDDARQIRTAKRRARLLLEASCTARRAAAWTALSAALASLPIVSIFPSSALSVSEKAAAGR
jgi:hypothetical protein